MSLPRTAIVLLLSIALAACASSSSSSSVPRSKRDVDDPKRQAAELQVKLGSGYMEQGKFETAHEKLERALELDPESIDGHTLMAVLFERIDRAKFAEKHYRRAVDLAPANGPTNNNYGAYLCRIGRYAEADGYFKRALDDPFYKSPESAWSNAGVCAARAGDHAKAEAYFRKSLEANPKDTGALYEMALISFKKSDFMRARAFIQRFEASARPDATALELGAQIEEKLGDTAAAAKYRERLKSEFPDYEPGTATKGSNSP
jgi:type IV pilus assembly protein PilF